MPAIRSAARAKAAPAISNPCGRRQCCDLAPLVSNCLSTRATVTDPNGDPVSRRVSRMSAFRQTFQPPLLPLLLRVARCLPVGAERAIPGGVWGEAWGKPQGRKPRSRTEGVSGSDELWGFERRRWAREA